MVSFLQVQCLNCGTVDDVISLDKDGDGSWCSQCGFTLATQRQMLQEQEALRRQLGMEEDQQLADLLSRNMWLSDSRPAPPQEVPVQQQPVAAPSPQPAQQEVVATPGANFSISQHYHHYRPLAPAPVAAPVVAAPPSPPSPPQQHQSPYIQQLLASPDPKAALQDYHQQLSHMEEQYYQRLQQQPPSPTLSISSSSTSNMIQDDQLQFILLEQHNLAQEAEKLIAREESMIFQQLMMENQHNMDMNATYGGKVVGGMDGWGQQQQVQIANPDVYDSNMMTGFEEEEESPCTIYYSRAYHHHGSHFL